MFSPMNWDPTSVFELENEQKYNKITCTGHARTCRRRCQRPIARPKIVGYVNILNRLAAEKSPLKAAFSDELRQAAIISLCWQHTGDFEDITRKWQEKLMELAFENELAKPCRNASRRTASTKRQESTGYSPRYRSVKVEDPESDVSGSESSDAPEYDSDDSDGHSEDSEDEDVEYTKEELRRQRERQQRERAARERQRKEAERREREEKRKEAERKEREREEAARKLRERKEAEAREARERADRIREQAKKRAEKEARKAKDEWSSVWQRYVEDWNRVTGLRPEEVRIEMVPWPVRSGRWEDVNSATVQEFFSKALPIHETPEAPEVRFRLISLENKRWHPDKIGSRFGADGVSGRYKEALTLIARELVLLRQQAKGERQK